MDQQWLKAFSAATGPILTDPFQRCLAEALAAVESDWGRRAIVGEGGLNEIGYKALPGRPSVEVPTRESDAGPVCTRRFRLFADREEQAKALRHLMHGSVYYEAARLLYVLAFYAAYAPGRVEGAFELVKVFNQLAAERAEEGIAPLRLAHRGLSPMAGHLNHRAAREAVRWFGDIATR